jgi:hypothetical protein
MSVTAADEPRYAVTGLPPIASGLLSVIEGSTSVKWADRHIAECLIERIPNNHASYPAYSTLGVDSPQPSVTLLSSVNNGFDIPSPVPSHPRQKASLP